MPTGIVTFRMHRAETEIPAGLDAAAAPGIPGVNLQALDAETVARRYLNSALAIDSVPVSAPDAGGLPTEFKGLGVDSMPFVGSKYVKFRQFVNKIPVYGSLATVELDKDNKLVSLNTSVGGPSDVSPTAKLSPEAALARVSELAGYGDRPLGNPARIYFYYDTGSVRWRLVYIVEDVLRMVPRRASEPNSVSTLPEIADFVVDAHTGELVAELPRTQTMSLVDREEASTDTLGGRRIIGVLHDDERNERTLHDRIRNIRTHDFQFADAFFGQFSLPGRLVTNPPAPWDPGSVSAHANARTVADFVRNVLQRDGLDGAGGAIISTVNCVFQGSAGSREWRNAARFRGQMIYGQREVNGEMRSYAASLDVVAHELLHGLTEHTARLEYRVESGALNESYSDIFGIIISNQDIDNVDQWNWEVGEDLTGTSQPLRDMSDPTKFGQPAHMQDFRVLPDEPDNDNGGVHINSGIHNKAAYNVLISDDSFGRKIFTPTDVARLYYVALVAHLSRTSKFSDCLEGMVLAAQSLYESSPDRQHKVEAIKTAYNAVGIAQAAAFV